MCQIDNFLKIYYNIEYEDKVTVKRAKEIILNIRVWSAVLTIIYLLLTPENAMCQTSPNPICSALKPSNYIWSMTTHGALYVVCILVISYLFKKVLKLNNTVAPVVNFPVQCQIGRQEDQAGMPGPSTKPMNTAGERRQIPSVSYSVRQAEVKIINHIEETIPGQVRERASSVQEEHSSVSRKNSNPSMFYRIPAPQSCIVPPPLVNTVETIKIFMKVSLQFLCIVLTLVPMNVLHTYHYFSGEECQDNLTMVRAISNLRTLPLIAYVALFFRKLTKTRLESTLSSENFS